MSNSLSALSLDPLKQAVGLREQIASLENERAAVIAGEVSTPAVRTSTALVPSGGPVGRKRDAE